MAEKNAEGSNGGPTDRQVSVELEKDGPLKVTGLTGFFNSRGEEITTKKSIDLCRCGASKNKPYCDGTHSQIGFTDEKSDDRGDNGLHLHGLHYRRDRNSLLLARRSLSSGYAGGVFGL